MATVILVIALTVLSGITYFWIYYAPSEKGYIKLDFVSATIVKPISVDGAGWQIKLLINNVGSKDAFLNKIYVNNELVSENGLIHGDELSSPFTVASSLADSGDFIQAGRFETVYLWVGREAYRKGETLSIELQYPDQIDLKKTVTLN